MLPKAEKREPLSIEVESELLAKIKREAKKRKLTLRQIVEFGFQNFLAETEKTK